MATPPSEKKARPPLQARTPAGTSTGTISSGVRLPRAPTAPLASTERATSQRRESSTGPLPTAGASVLERRREQSLGAATGNSRPSGTPSGYAKDNSRARSSSGARRSPVAAAVNSTDPGEGPAERQSGSRSGPTLDPQRVTRAVSAPVVKSVLRDVEPCLRGLFDELCGLTSAGLTQRHWQLALQVLGRSSSGPEVRSAFLQSGDGSRLPFDSFQAALLHLCAAHGSIDGKDIAAALARELRRWLVDEQQINEDQASVRAKARALVQEQGRKGMAGKGSPKSEVTSGANSGSDAAATSSTATPERPPCPTSSSSSRSGGRARTVPNLDTSIPNSNSRGTHSTSSSLVFEPGSRKSSTTSTEARSSSGAREKEVCAKSCSAERGRRSAGAKETCSQLPAQMSREGQGATSLEEASAPTEEALTYEDITGQSVGKSANEDTNQQDPRKVTDQMSAPIEVSCGQSVGSNTHVDDASGAGMWEVNTTSKGWAPLAPALQPALDEAMSMDVDHIELIIDPVARIWVRELNSLDESIQQRCVTYIALPKEQKMGKVGGAPPRPVRRRPGSDESGGVESAMQIAVATHSAAACNILHSEDDKDSLDGDVTESADDPLMFTAHPADGILINEGVLERIRQGAAERQACHRYSETLETPLSPEA